MTYVVEYNDESGNLVDIEQYCNRICADRVERDTTHTVEGDWPGGIETDYNEYCPACGTMLNHGLEVDDCDDRECPECPPVVQNLVGSVDDYVLCGRCGCTQYIHGHVLASLPR